MFLPVLPVQQQPPSLLRRRSSVRGANANPNANGSITIRSPHRTSLRQDVPLHLQKFLQKTPEQQQRHEAVKLILADEPCARNELSLDLVYDWMLLNCKQYSNNIFGSAPEYIRREICRQMRLIKSPSHNMLIRQGDTGDRCYIVIDGIVDVYVQKETAAGTSASVDADNPPRPRIRRANSFMESRNLGLLNVEYGEMVANLGPGAMFGEVVLNNPTARRNATILSSQYTESCDLICLERADYIRLVRTASMEASHYNHAEILDQMHLFQGWAKSDKMRLVSGMRSLKFLCNEYLYKAGNEAKYMFIVTSGDVIERLNWELSDSSSTNSNSSSSCSIIDVTSPKRTLRRSNNAGPERKVNIELALYGPGELVGELPFLLAKRSANVDVKAVTDVQTLAIDRRLYESMVTQSSVNSADATPASSASSAAVRATLQLLKRMSEDREDWRRQRLECGAAYPNTQIPITWQVMRMSNLRCPRCGQRGHLASDAARCRNPPPVKGGKSPRRVAPIKSVITAFALESPRERGSLRRREDTPRRNSSVRDLFDDDYLPTAKEQLASCRRPQQQSMPT